MSGDESAGPTERDEHDLPDQRVTGEIPIPEQTSAPDDRAAATITDPSLDAGAAGEGDPADEADPWPDLANVAAEETWDASFDAPAYEVEAAPGPVPPPPMAPWSGPVSLGTDRRVAPQQDDTQRPPVPMAGAAPGIPPAAAPSVPRVPGDPPGAGDTQEAPAPRLSPAPGLPPAGVPQVMVAGPLPHQPPPRSGNRRPILLAAAAAAVAVIVAVAAAVVFWSDGESKRPAAAPAPTGAATPGTSATPPAAGGAPTARPSSPGTGGAPVQPTGAMPGAPTGSPGAPQQIPNGAAVRYQTVQEDPGYFEGVLTVTNRTGAPMHAWELSFTYPMANVKNIWEAVLVRGGDRPVVRSMQSAEAIPPGGSLEVRFGAEGSPSAPRDCLFGGAPCSFG